MKKMMSILLVFLVVGATLFTTRGTAEEKPLLVGMEAAYPPYNWTQSDDSNNALPIKGSNDFANGYDVQIARKIGEALQRPVQIVKTEWDGLIPALNAGKIDLIIAGMSPTEQRQKAIDFSEPYYESEFVLVMKKDSPYASAKTLKDFKDAKVTGQLGTLHYDLLSQLEGANVQQAQKSFPVMRVGLEANKIDAYISELPEGMSAVQANDQLMYVQLEEGFEVADEDKMTAIGIKKGNAILTQVNEVLKQVTKEERAKIMEQVLQWQP